MLNTDVPEVPTKDWTVYVVCEVSRESAASRRNKHQKKPGSNAIRPSK